MKVLYCPEANVMRPEEHPDPTLTSSSDALVEVERVSICGSDGGRFHGTNALLPPPHIGGHEYAGVIRLLGELAAKENPHLAVGMSVSGIPIDYCGTCVNCQAGLPQHCADRRVIGAHPQWPGAFAQKLTTPAKLLVPMKDGMSFDAGCVNEPAACATWVGQVAEEESPSRTLKGNNGVIAGGGPIGFFCLQDVLLRGADKVVVIDLNDERLAAAEAAGAIPFNPSTATGDILEEIPKLLGGLADFSIDCVGLGKVSDQCGRLTKPRHPTIWYGLHDDKTRKVAGGQYVRFGVKAVGAFGFTPEAFKLAGKRLAEGSMGFPEERVVVCGFDDGQRWFDILFNGALAEDGMPLKVIFDTKA